MEQWQCQCSHPQKYSGSACTAVRSDKMSIVLGFADGSIGSLHYFANGHKSFPKERFEVFDDEKVLILDNFKKL